MERGTRENQRMSMRIDLGLENQRMNMRTDLGLEFL